MLYTRDTKGDAYASCTYIYISLNNNKKDLSMGTTIFYPVTLNMVFALFSENFNVANNF